MISNPRPPAPRPLLAVLLLAALSSGGCDDPSCVFGGNCADGPSDGTPGLGSEAATFPSEGSLSLEGPPELRRFAPQGPGAHAATAVFLEFTESIDPQSLIGAFELRDLSFQQPVPLTPGPVPTAAEGRVAVLVPVSSVSLTAGDQFEIRYTEGAVITDLNGQTLALPTDLRIGEFTVELTPTSEPRVIATFPDDLETTASDLGSIVVVFDRPMDAASVDDDSFQVLVDGEDPPFDPPPVPLAITGGSIPVPVLHAYRWRSIDSAGQPVSLGVGAQVEVLLSPSSAPILPQNEEDDALEPDSFSFELADVRAPMAVLKDPISEPPHAIGGANLVDPTAPVVLVQLHETPAATDSLAVFLFGTSVGSEPILRSQLREVDLDGTTDAIVLTEEELDLLDENGLPLFAEGEIEIAVSLRRGDVSSALRRFDADLDTPEPELPVLDVTAPALVGFGTDGSSLESFTSAVRDLAVVGLAGEEISAALVTTTVGGAAGPDNTLGIEAGPPPVAGSSAGGLFVARPVPLGVLAPDAGEVRFSITLFDDALNESAPLEGALFLQRGLVEGGGLVASQPILVRVLDGPTLAPLPGALVIVQEELAGTFQTVTTLTTGSGGTVEVPAAPSGSTVLTVHLEGYDLFTFSGVTGPALDVLLEATGASLASTGGVVVSPLLVDLAGKTNLVGDSRLPAPGDPLILVDSCIPDEFTGTLRCPFGPAPILPSILGGQSFLSARLDLHLGGFVDPGAFLAAFSLRYPAGPTPPGVLEEVLFEIDSLLALQPSEERAIALPPTTIDEPTGDAFGDLVGDPEVTVEGVAAGLRSALPVGLGKAFAEPVPWTVVGAYPGAVDGIPDSETDELGRLVQSGAVEGDLLLRMELVDDLGNRVGIRPRLSSPTLDMQPLASTEVPALREPAAGSTTGGSAYVLEFDDVFPDAFGTQGLYRVTLTSVASGRRWVLWRTDAMGGGGMDRLVLQLPPIAALGGVPLPSGAVEARVAAFAWPSLDLVRDRMLWSDVEREFERFGFAASVSFQQP